MDRCLWKCLFQSICNIGKRALFGVIISMLTTQLSVCKLKKVVPSLLNCKKVILVHILPTIITETSAYMWVTVLIWHTRWYILWLMIDRPRDNPTYLSLSEHNIIHYFPNTPSYSYIHCTCENSAQNKIKPSRVHYDVVYSLPLNRDHFPQIGTYRLKYTSPRFAEDRK